jgi:hypothetical protein
MKRLIRRQPGVGAGCAFVCIAVLALFLGACSGGSSSMPDASRTPASPVAPAEPVAPAANAVSAAAQVEGEILAYVGVPSTIKLAFSTNEGIASGLVLTLPAVPGWRAANDVLRCATVDTTGTCRLQLVYTPTAPAASTSVRLPFIYTDSAGASREGVHTLAYRVAPANTVVTSQQPPGALRGIVGRSASVTLDFGTSDGEPAASFRVTSSLADLPAGWTSDRTELACSGVSRQPCRLTLAYSPTAAQGASGLTIAYSYVDSSGASRSGTARVDYSAIVPGSVVASLSTSGLLLARPGDQKEITVRFGAGDGIPASALRLAGPVTTPDWSIKPGWQDCDTVEGDDSCSLTLVFAPSLVRAPAVLSLPYTYVDNVGETRSSSVDIAYTSRLYEAYIADSSGGLPGGVRLCTIDADGDFSNCAAAEIALPRQGLQISGVLATGRRAYVASQANGDSSSVFLCAVTADGTLEKCHGTGDVRTGIRRVLLHGTSAYLLFRDGDVLRQVIDLETGEITPCPADRGNCVIAGGVSTLGLAGTKAYIGRTIRGDSMDFFQCSISANGDLDCNASAFFSGPFLVADGMAGFQEGTVSRLYIAGKSAGGVFDFIKCAVPDDAPVGECQGNFVADRSDQNDVAYLWQDIALDGSHAYILRQGDIQRCDISPSNGNLSKCQSADEAGATNQFALSINRLY